MIKNQPKFKFVLITLENMTFFMNIFILFPFVKNRSLFYIIKYKVFDI